MVASFGNQIQERSQDLEKGGAFLKEWEKCKRSWPEFSWFLNQSHTVCPKTETEFLGKFGNSNVFSAQKQVISKKKGLHRNWDCFFGQNRKFKRFFCPKTGDLQKKKTVFTEIETDFSAKIGNSNAFSSRITTCTSKLRHQFPLGGLFLIFHQNQKHQICAILHTSQANGGALAPRPPGYATDQIRGLLSTALEWNSCISFICDKISAF